MGVPEMPIIDLGEISFGRRDLFGCLQDAVNRASQENTLIRFMSNDIEITVAADSNIELIAETYWEYDCLPDDKSGKIGPYPAMLTFDDTKARPYRVAHWVTQREETMQAYQLGEEGWVETTDIRGALCVDSYGIASDWYVKCANGKFELWSNEAFTKH